MATAARDDATGRLVAFTDINTSTSVDWSTGMCGRPTRSSTRRTAATASGCWSRRRTWRWLRVQHPAVRAIDTWNADSNPWMVSINEAMGFRPLDRWCEW